MLTQNSFKELCKSLHFDLRSNCEGYQVQLKDISNAVALAFQFDDARAIKRHLKNSSILVSPKMCQSFCSIVKSRFGFHYYRSPFTFKWPSCFEFTANEVGQFWRHSFANINIKFGADVYRMMTPIMQYKKGRWIVAPESPITVDQINSVIGDGIATLEKSHTDIVLKLNESAANGDIAALYGIAQRHLKNQDNASAFEALGKVLSLDKQYEDALTHLAMIYFEGAENCVEVDLIKSEELYRQASDLGSAQAAHVLGVNYDLNGLFQQDFKQAFKFHELATQRGNHYSINCLITMIIFNRGVPESLESEYLESLFSKGLKLADPNTAQRIAEYYESNNLKTYEQLFELRCLCFKIGAKTKLVNVNLAKYYLHGLGCSKNINLAIKHYKIESEQFGCADSMYQLALIYKNELKDDNAYYDWLNKALNAIDDNTMYTIHILFLLGHHAQLDRVFDVASTLFMRVIDFNRTAIYYQNPEFKDQTDNFRNKAKLNLGWIQYYHLDSSYGFDLISEAALAGFTPAKYILAGILINDYEDLIFGEMWLRQAKDDGHEEAAQKYESLFNIP